MSIVLSSLADCITKAKHPEALHGQTLADTLDSSVFGGERDGAGPPKIIENHCMLRHAKAGLNPF